MSLLTSTTVFPKCSSCGFEAPAGSYCAGCGAHNHEVDHPSCPVALMQQVEALRRERDEKERDRVLAVTRLEQWEATFTVLVCEVSKLKKKLAVNERQLGRIREKNAALRSKSGLQKRLIDTYERLLSRS